ncbi:MAG: thermonuclease family protein [Methylomicrobium sp.]|nr:thermonuclease family protein [Methylomicrobium sp.]
MINIKCTALFRELPERHYTNRIAKLLLILVSLSACPAHAEIYEWRDEQGQVHFSDKKTERARPVEISPGIAFYHVTKVFDGDTILLVDGRKVRLLGINTPEIAHRNQEAEAGGIAAKNWLTAQLLNKRIRLVMDVESHDAYDRVLAHVFTDDHRHINAELVEQGFAAVVIHPPNLEFLDTLLAAQEKAEKSRLGIWRLPEYEVKAADALNRANYRGWQRLQGQIESIRWSKKYVYVNLTPQVDLRIERKQLGLFSDLAGLRGKTIEARGWINRRKDHYSMLVRHPSSIRME